ncbi:MAG: zinc-binding dehydrogenase [Bacilli bacterium]|nr:zinc-binding dehydrogenase [Bacilli bacterium]
MKNENCNDHECSCCSGTKTRKKMQGLIYKGVMDFEKVELDYPECGPKDVVVKNIMSSVCGTDITTMTVGGAAVGVDKNDQFGHEFIAVVDEVGSEINFVKPGDRVFVSHCDRRPPKCGQSKIKIGNTTGAFSQYVYIQEAVLNYNIFPIPDSMTYERGVLIEPLSIGVHAVNRVSGINKDSNVIVYGSGSIGLCTVMVLQDKGIKNIIVVDIDDYKLSFAKKFNVTTFNSKSGDVVDFVKKTWGTCDDVTNTKTWNVDYVFDCAGAKSIITDFIDNAKPASTCVLVAIPKYIEEIPLKKIVMRESNLIGSIICNEFDSMEAIKILSKKENNLDEKIISDVFPFAQIVEAMHKAISGKCLKVVIDFRK